METIEKSIEVEAPVHVIYNQWTQFEDFPRFMQGIEQVVQIDNERLHWVANIAGKRKEWDAEIVDQVLDQRISWRSTSGARNSGTVNFYPTNGSTRILLELKYDPEGATETVADKIGVVGRRVEGDLKRFKEFIEGRGAETGAWRGEIHAGRQAS